MNIFQRILYRPFFIKLLHWEYWPFNIVYAPTLPVWLWLCIRARSFFFFSASNPTIYSGGFLMESKNEINKIIPKQYYPQTVFFKAGTTVCELKKVMSWQQMEYPLIAKPDVGARGRGVRKLKNEADLLDYAATSKLDFLVQQFIPYALEAGIFYCRYPEKEKGFITGIVAKEFISVTGDGQSSIYDLLLKEKRFVLQMDALKTMYGEGLKMVLPAGENKIMMPYGNHARGAKFIDASHMIDDKLSAFMDEMCRQIDGFYYGRFDIKFNCWDELKQGKNFSIIELNGAGAEPTHMYDPRHSIFFAWKEIIRHNIILWRISRANHKNGTPYMKHKEGVQMFKDNKDFEKKLEALYV